MITTITLNASIDKAYYMEGSIENGTVMRVASCRNSAGGKGLNVARTAKLCGARVQAAGFAGGFNGQYLGALLKKDGIPHCFAHVAGETRSCINILDEEYGSTEYLEPGCRITPEEEAQFMEQFPDMIRDSEVITISGSVPQGIKKDIYGRMISIARELGKKVILDTSGDLLRSGVRACPTMIKPNREELEQLFQVKIRGIGDVITYAEKFRQQGIPNVVISLGSEGAMLVCGEGIFRGRPPKVEAVNTVGCGDSMVGAFAVSMEREESPAHSLKYAVAVATANALSPNTGDFAGDICRELMDRVTIEKL